MRSIQSQVALSVLAPTHRWAPGRRPSAGAPRRRRLIAGRAVAGVAVLSTALVSGCAASASSSASSSSASASAGAGFTDKTVRLASSYPTSLAGPDEMLGLQAYFDSVNASGGVKMA